MNAPQALSDYAHLVQTDRIHGSIYTDPAIFEQEMARIFHRGWLCLGHEAEIPQPGDFRATTLGRQPVLMVRGDDGQVRVFMNRCRHRGMTLCEDETGNEKFLRCWYHGWVYRNTGELEDVPLANAYGAQFRREDFGLTPVPRMESYRGFVFASLAPTGQSLLEHLGLARRYLDIFLDASPTGEIDVTAGVHRTRYRGNWKFVGMDGYHPHYTHRSVMDSWKRRPGGGMANLHHGDPFCDESGNLTRDAGNGHVLLDMFPSRLAHVDEYLAGIRKRPGGEDYIAAMQEAHGPQRARELLAWAGDPHVGIYPNLQLIGIQIRIIRPLAVDDTEVLMFPALLKDVPPSINEMRLRQHESFYGPAGAGAPDDAEIFERNQQGLGATVEPWVYLARGLERERQDTDGSIIGMPGDETTQRGQLREWKRMMSEA
ncbi:Rieske 2Fe-2S domain-containing protein [Immundisolibacter sp.]|uniref:aromatic ring-hydroxylating oxygenase subunit alpha n=1 Tax=Immundisolibacter sp. TaxID=1934948 RepID=UPI003562FFB5